MTTQHRRPRPRFADLEPGARLELVVLDFRRPCGPLPAAGGEPREAIEARPADPLPEHATYRDEGCDLFPSCLACPLVRCRYDVPGGVRTLRNADRNREVRAMHDAGHSVDAIAAHFAISRRTVFRILQPPRRAATPRSTEVLRAAEEPGEYRAGEAAT